MTDPGAAPSPTPAPSSGGALKLIPVLVAAAAFAVIVVWFLREKEPESGIEIGYRMLAADAAPVAPRVTEVLTKRLKELRADPFYITIDRDLVVIKLPGASKNRVEDVKRLLRTVGHLELRPVADRATQEKYRKDEVVPDGYQLVRSVDARGGEYEAWQPWMLVQKKSVIDGAHFVDAEPHQEMVPGGARWVTSFELDAEGAKRFDEAAEKLYNQRPPGLLAIMLDGELKSAPAVQSPAFHGRGQISGAQDAQAAKDLAIVLRSGKLPVPLGGVEGGEKKPGVPQFERPFGPKK